MSRTRYKRRNKFWGNITGLYESHMVTLIRSMHTFVCAQGHFAKHLELVVNTNQKITTRFAWHQHNTKSKALIGQRYIKELTEEKNRYVIEHSHGVGVRVGAVAPYAEFSYHTNMVAQSTN